MLSLTIHQPFSHFTLFVRKQVFMQICIQHSKHEYAKRAIREGNFHLVAMLPPALFFIKYFDRGRERVRERERVKFHLKNIQL